jgi:hypothetical protein
VLEAYWIGNDLLEQIPKKKFYTHLLESQQIKRRLGKKSFNLITNKLRHNAVPHHSFHVFNIWQRTGHLQQEHTLESMDNCRISWGTVQTIDGPWLLVKTNPLVYQNKKLMLGEPTIKKITRSLDAPIEIDELKPDDIITMHWNTPCEVITHQQALTLKKYTLRHLKLANQTL